MQGSKSVVRLNAGRPPLEINNVQKTTNSKTGVFSTRRCITYTLGKRLLSLTITNMGSDGRVNVVTIDLNETSGKGATANLNLRIIRNERYGVLCNMNTKLAGSYDSFKEHYNVPPLPDTELVCYVCRETGLGGCFTLEKKKEVVKATHAFVVDDEIVFSVKIRIREMGDRLSVEVEDPLKLTMDYTKQVISKIRGRWKVRWRLHRSFISETLSRDFKATGTITKTKTPMIQMIESWNCEFKRQKVINI